MMATDDDDDNNNNNNRTSDDVHVVASARCRQSQFSLGAATGGRRA